MMEGIEIEEHGAKKVKMGLDFNIEITKTTLKKKLPMWTKYTWENIENLKRKAEKKGVSLQHFSVDQLRPKFLYLPTLIVGWGDSFHHTVDMLKEIPRDKCNIIACDRPLRKMVDHGCVPDLIMNLDAGPQIRPFYQVNLPERERTKLNACFAICTDPRQFQWFHGNKYWFVPAITPWGNNLTEDTLKVIHYPCVPTAGNIGTASVMLSRSLGAAPTFLIGIDFGYREYPDHTERCEIETLNPQSKKVWEMGPVKLHSDPVLFAYAHATRHLLLTYDIDCINIGGGLLHGKWIKTVSPSPDNGGSARERMDAFIKQLKGWTIPPETIAAREKFKLTGIANPRAFMPSKRKIDPNDKELMKLYNEAINKDSLVLKKCP